MTPEGIARRLAGAALLLALACAGPRAVREPVTAHDYYERGVARAQRGHYDKAIAEFTRSIELDPLDGKAFLNRGVAHARSGRPDDDLDAFDDLSASCAMGTQEGCAAAMAWMMGEPVHFVE